MTRSRILVATLLTSISSPILLADDWPQWRGPNRDGRSQETGLLKSWPEDGPPLAWKVRNVGGGFSSVAVAGGTIYTLGDLEDGCHVIALKEADGSPLWKTKVGESGGHRGYPGPRSTPTVDGEQVFALDQHGTLTCLAKKSGDKIWSVNLQTDFGARHR